LTIIGQVHIYLPSSLSSPPSRLTCGQLDVALLLQIAFSDKILMNKIDLVSKQELIDLKKTIASINSFAELIETVQ